jgi:predicted nucleotidyltransferase
VKEIFMRITLDQKIAGYPAGQIRQLMRETVGRSITLRYVREILQCSDSAAIQVLNHLQEQGFVEPIQDHLEPSTKGSALAMATAAAPLRRETAERLIANVVERAQSINEDDKWSYRIGKLVVFGSFLRGAERLNDVDMACELLPRWTGERQAQAEQVRREVRRQSFRNMIEWAAWPKLEVIQYLKSRARGLAIQEIQEWILETTAHQVLLNDVPEIAVSPGSGRNRRLR